MPSYATVSMTTPHERLVDPSINSYTTPSTSRSSMGHAGVMLPLFHFPGTPGHVNRRNNCRRCKCIRPFVRTIDTWFFVVANIITVSYMQENLNPNRYTSTTTALKCQQKTMTFLSTFYQHQILPWPAKVRQRCAWPRIAFLRPNDASCRDGRPASPCGKTFCTWSHPTCRQC